MELPINSVTRRWLFQGAIALLGTMASSRDGYAATKREQEARVLVKSLVEHILHVIGSDGGGSDGGSSGVERRLMAAIEGQTDLTLLARMTLGRYWRQATARQQKVFVDVFRHYLLQSFIARLRSYVGADPDHVRDRFAITGTRKVGKSDVVVRSRIKPPSGAALVVDWRIRSRDGRSFIIDLVVEGVSLLITQRSEFSSVLERIGIDGLISELQSRVSRPI